MVSDDTLFISWWWYLLDRLLRSGHLLKLLLLFFQREASCANGIKRFGIHAGWESLEQAALFLIQMSLLTSCTHGYNRVIE